MHRWVLWVGNLLQRMSLRHYWNNQYPSQFHKKVLHLLSSLLPLLLFFSLCYYLFCWILTCTLCLGDANDSKNKKKRHSNILEEENSKLRLEIQKIQTIRTGQLNFMVQRYKEREIRKRGRKERREWREERTGERRNKHANDIMLFCNS